MGEGIILINNSLELIRVFVKVVKKADMRNVVGKLKVEIGVRLTN